jgi:cyanophycinase
MVLNGWGRAVLALAGLMAGGAFAAPGEYRDKHFDYFVAGDPAAPRAAATRGGIALMGGGGTVDAAYRFIAERGGHGHIVVLGADSDGRFDPSLRKYDLSFMTRWGPVVSAETFVFHDRDAASDPRVLAALRGADGIFLMGGDQGDYVRYWKGTPVQEALDAHVRAGRPIGGSSAGLAVLGGYLYGCLDGHSLESREALADPFHASVTLLDDFLHFSPLGSVVTDTHFGERHRLGRLSVFVARLDRDHPAAKVMGIGVDEATALLVDPDGAGVLAAGSKGSAWIVIPTEPADLAPGRPLTAGGLHLLRMGAASRLDVTARRVEAPTSDTVMRISGGALEGGSDGAAIFTRSGPSAGED